jgi:two-component system osmolarity sensor histidine kinase EnvZ
VTERARPSLAAYYARWLVAVFVVVELVFVASAVVFVLLPLERRAADDFVGLLVLSSETWAELPPQTRPVFEQELEHTYQIALRPNMTTPPDTGLTHSSYVYFIERAFERQIGREVFFTEEPGPDGTPWLWTALPAGQHSIGVGFARARIQTYPLIALALATAAAVALVGAIAWRLARWITRPITRLEQAAAHLAQGADPELLAETGPRELADLARHFNQMASQLAELNEARTTLFAGISHDLRTPLARMRLSLEMLDPPPQPATLRRLEADIEQMNRLITVMLEIARGLATEPAQEIALHDWLKARIEARTPIEAGASTTFSIDCDPALRIHAAPGMLARVFDNLIENAMRYAPGPINLVAQDSGSSEHAPSVRIGVLDRGPSIPPDQLQAVFRPFHRVDRSRSSARGGFGLGLAIVRQLAKANGWRVRLANRAGGGLEAWVEIDRER